MVSVVPYCVLCNSFIWHISVAPHERDSSDSSLDQLTRVCVNVHSNKPRAGTFTKLSTAMPVPFSWQGSVSSAPKRLHSPVSLQQVHICKPNSPFPISTSCLQLSELPHSLTKSKPNIHHPAEQQVLLFEEQSGVCMLLARVVQIHFMTCPLQEVWVHALTAEHHPWDSKNVYLPGKLFLLSKRKTHWEERMHQSVYICIYIKNFSCKVFI